MSTFARDNDVLLGTTDTAAELELSETHTKHLIDTGAIPSTRTRNGRRLVRLSDARAYAKSRRRKRRLNS